MENQEANEDKAWASILTPLSVPELMIFISDIERLFRINPLIEFTEWQSIDCNQHTASGTNISQKKPFKFNHKIDVTTYKNKRVIAYSEGIKLSTTLEIEPDQQGSKLTITDVYKVDQDNVSASLTTIDKSLIPWANDIQHAIFSWKRWSWLPLWRWYMKKIWQPMKPSARRITYMILWITFAEFLGVILVALIYYLQFA